MRILILGIDWPPETFIARLIRGLLQAGVYVTVAGSRRPGKEWFAYSNFGWQYASSGRSGALVRSVTFFADMAAACVRDPKGLAKVVHAARQCKKWKERLKLMGRVIPYAGKRWDVIYFPWNLSAVAHEPVFEMEIPVVVSCRGSQVSSAPHNPERPQAKEGLKRTFNKAAAVHCVSRAIRDEAAKYGLDPAKAHVINPAVDPEFFSPDARPDTPGTFRIVTTGSLTWQKGYEYALLAIKEFSRIGVPFQFRIIGAGPDIQRIEYAIHDLDLLPHVQLLGKLPPDQVRNVLRDSDVFLLSSLSEGISNAVLEAMSCGLPVVTTDCGGMREAVSDGAEGFVVPSRDPAAMATALERIAKDRGLRQKLGNAARLKVLEKFNLKDQISGFVRLFESVCESKA